MLIAAARADAPASPLLVRRVLLLGRKERAAAFLPVPESLVQSFAEAITTSDDGSGAILIILSRGRWRAPPKLAEATPARSNRAIK